MKIKHGYCKYCGKDVAMIGQFCWGSFLFCLLLAMFIFPLLPFVIIMAFFNYDWHCPHCGRRLK